MDCVSANVHSASSPCGQRTPAASLVLGLTMWLALASGLLVDMTGAVDIKVLANLAWSLCSDDPPQENALSSSWFLDNVDAYVGQV